MNNRVYRRPKRRKGKNKKALVIILPAALLVVAVLLALFLRTGVELSRLANLPAPEWVDVQLIEIDGAARRGTRLEGLRDIVVHYTGNPGTSAQQNRDYFNTPGVGVSAHYIIGLGGEVIQCIPLDEKSSASNERNRDTISIEVCHPDDSGAFTQASYDSLIRLLAWLCDHGGLTEQDIIRHYDVTGKNCPKYYVENADAWEQLKQDVKAYGGEGKDD